MKGISRPIDIFNTVSKCLKEYDKNLRNTKVMFVIENKDRTLSKEEVYFPKSSYKHLTGVSIIEKSTGKMKWTQIVRQKSLTRRVHF